MQSGDQLRAAILDAASTEHPVTPAAMRAAITARGQGVLLARVEQSITHPSDWPAREGTAEDDVSAAGGRTSSACIASRGRYIRS